MKSRSTHKQSPLSDEMEDRKMQKEENGINIKKGLAYDQNAWIDYLGGVRERLDAYEKTGAENEANNAEYKNAFIDDLHKWKEDNKKKILKYAGEYEDAINEEYVNKLYYNSRPLSLRYALHSCKIMVITANPVELAILHSRMAKRNSRKIRKIVAGNVVYFTFRWGEYEVVHLHQLE